MKDPRDIPVIGVAEADAWKEPDVIQTSPSPSPVSGRDQDAPSMVEDQHDIRDHPWQRNVDGSPCIEYQITRKRGPLTQGVSLICVNREDATANRAELLSRLERVWAVAWPVVERSFGVWQLVAAADEARPEQTERPDPG